MRKMASFFLALLLIYSAAVGFLYFKQRSFMYFPDRTSPHPADYHLSDSVVVKAKTDDGLELQGWYFEANPGVPVIVYFHGNGGHYAHRYSKILFYLEAGYGVLLAEYRGYGGNPGSPSEQGFYSDARAWMKFLRDKSVSPENTILYGESIGSGVATQMATETKARALILEAPFTSAAALGQRLYFYMPVKYLMKDVFDNASKVGTVEMPVLILHGTDDATIPLSFGKALFDKAQEPKTFMAVEKAGHNDLYDHGAALLAVKFLRTIDAQTGSDLPFMPDSRFSPPLNSD